MAERIDILIGARNQSGPALDGVKRDLRSIDQLANNLNAGLTGVGAIAGIGAVVAGIQQIGAAIDDLSRRGAIFEQLDSVLDSYAASVNETADAFIEAGRKASAGTIADFDLILNSNRAIQFEVAKTSDQYAKLIELATALGRAQGISDSQALEFLTTGLARESRLILDNLGLIIDLEDATSAYAETLGKTANQLTTAERKQALLNEAFRQGETAIAANRAAVDSAATTYERFDANVQNLKDEFGKLAAVAGTDAISALATQTALLTDVLSGDRKVSTIEQQIRGLIQARDELANAEPVSIFGFEVSDNSALIEKLNRDISALESELKNVKFPTASLQGAVDDAFELADAAGFAQRRLDELSAQSAAAEINALEEALDGIPEQLERLVRAEIKFSADVDDSEITNALGIDTNALRLEIEADVDVSRFSSAELTEIVNEVRDEFQTLEKAQESTRQKIIQNAIKASDIIGDDAAFDLAERQIGELQDRIDALGVRLFNQEINPDEFLFELNKIPGAVSAIFDDISEAGAEGTQALSDRLRQLFDLRDSIQISIGVDADSAQLDAINEQIQRLESTLGIIDPAALRAAQGITGLELAIAESDDELAAMVANAQNGGDALDGFGRDAQQAANEVNLLAGALAGAPAGLVALANAAVAAGAPLDQVSAKVAALRGEFNALAGAQAGLRRTIINRAADVADIVGDERALAIAGEQIGLLETRAEAFQQQLFDGTLTAEEYEFQLARLDGSLTGVFDSIEETDRKSQQLANTVGGNLSNAFSDLQSKVQGVLSNAFNVDVGINTDSLLPREDAVNEDARRLADVAVRGYDSPWASYLSNKFPDLIGAAFDNSGGDVKTTAARILRDFEDGLVPQLIDKETAKERVRRALIGEANTAALAKDIATELAAEFGGQFSSTQIRATAGVTLGVQGAESEQLAATLTGAATNVEQRLTGIGTSLKTGIISALDGLGEAVGSALDKQLRSEGNLKQIRSAGFDNGITWGEGFLESMDELTGQVLEKLASLVAPYVEATTTSNATLTGAN